MIAGSTGALYAGSGLILGTVGVATAVVAVGVGIATAAAVMAVCIGITAFDLGDTFVEEEIAKAKVAEAEAKNAKKATDDAAAAAPVIVVAH